MKLVVGLGNPGPAYEGSRHNLGAMAVRRLARELNLGRFRRVRYGLAAGRETRFGTRRGPAGSPDLDITLLLPTTYMNRSGVAVSSFIQSRPIQPADIIVIHDDLDLAVGRVRVRVGGSAGGHRGVASIIDETGFDGFVRVKIGIGRPPDDVDPVEYVLRRPAGEERASLLEAVDVAARAVLAVLKDGPGAAMNHFNRRAEPTRDETVVPC